MARRPRVLLVALGDTEVQARALVLERYEAASLEVLERSALRRRPWSGLRRLLDPGYDDFLLFAPDLTSARLRWAKALALLSRARRKWLADVEGRLERFSGPAYLAREVPGALGHLGATLAMLALAPVFLLGLGLWLRAERRFLPRRFRALESAGGLRVAYLRTQFWFGLQAGGSVAHTAGVVGGLQQQGARVIALASDALSDVGAKTVVIRPEVWYDGVLRELEELLYNVEFVWRALPALGAERPNALYQRYTALSVAGALLSRWLRVPLVLEFNSSDVWKARYWGEFRLLPLVQLGEWVNLAGADVIVVVSSVLRDELVRRGVSAERILVNPNGVDTDVFHPGVSGERVRARDGLQERVVVGFSGTFGAWHGVPTLAAALPLIAPKEAIHVLLLGDGPLRPLVDDAVAKHGLAERVTLVGTVPHSAMPEHLAACDVLIAPHGRQADGREFFGSPTKLFEYMAMGKAIAASNVGQMGQVLRHEENALLVEPESAQALAAAILRLAADPELRARLGQAARRDALANHTWRRNAARLLERLGELAQE